MNKVILIVLSGLMGLSICAQSKDDMKVRFTVNGSKVLEMELVDNSSTEALLKRLQQSEIAYTSSPYGGFESVGGIGFPLPTNDTDIETCAGDVILYQGRNICLYYDTNRWTFTKLGRITNATQSELKSLLGDKTVTIVISKSGSSDVTEIESDAVKVRGEFYTIDGRRLIAAPKSGIYIENGVKKVK